MELNSLIAECTAYDFKLMLEEKKPKSWLKSVSAFANGLGGAFSSALIMMASSKDLMMCSMFARLSVVGYTITWILYQRWR